MLYWLSNDLPLHDNPALLLPGLMRQLGASRLVCEEITVPEEQAAPCRRCAQPG